MDPQQNQYPIDYLNQIAPQQPATGVNNKKFFFIIGGVLIVVIIALIMIFSSASGGPKDKMQTLAARLMTLQDISKKAQTNIKSGALRATNSNYVIFLTNANRDIADPLKINGVDVKKIDKAIKTKEDGSELTEKLENARLNAIYDRTYSREMAYQLEKTAALMGDIYDHTNSKSLKEFLLKTDENLQPIRKTFSEYSDKNG